MNLSQIIEAVLFWKSEPMTIVELAKASGVEREAVVVALDELERSLSTRGIVLMRKDDEVSLGTTPVVSDLITKLAKEELSRELSKATLETLSVVLYKGPISRAEIDYIRGVQSAFMLRQLTVRGLIEKVSNPKDQRSFLYRPSFELLAHLGVSKIEDLPEYVDVQRDLEAFVSTQEMIKDKTEDAVGDSMVQKEPIDETITNTETTTKTQ